MKKIGMLLSLLAILSILSNIDLAFAEPSISIETSQSVYEYGDHLIIIINVSEITGDDASIYITHFKNERAAETDPAKTKKSLLLQPPISQKYVELPSNFPFDSAIWKHGTYELELEYSGSNSSVQFTIEDTGKVGLPYWIRDLAKLWLNEPAVTDKDFARALEYLIEHGIINIPYTEQGEESDSSKIPEWMKIHVDWWLRGMVDDTTFVGALQYLINVGVITVNLSKV